MRVFQRFGAVAAMGAFIGLGAVSGDVAARDAIIVSGSVATGDGLTKSTLQFNINSSGFVTFYEDGDSADKYQSASCDEIKHLARKVNTEEKVNAAKVAIRHAFGVDAFAVQQANGLIGLVRETAKLCMKHKL